MGGWKGWITHSLHILNIAFYHAFGPAFMTAIVGKRHLGILALEGFTTVLAGALVMAFAAYNNTQFAVSHFFSHFSTFRAIDLPFTDFTEIILKPIKNFLGD